MKIPKWLDEKEAEGVDVSQIELPDDLLYDAEPSEVVFFEVYRPCSMLCAKNHPFATVERFKHWYYCRGQDKKAGIHTKGMEWKFFTKNKELAIRTAKSHME